MRTGHLLNTKPRYDLPAQHGPLRASKSSPSTHKLLDREWEAFLYLCSGDQATEAYTVFPKDGPYYRYLGSKTPARLVSRRAQPRRNLLTRSSRRRS